MFVTAADGTQLHVSDQSPQALGGVAPVLPASGPAPTVLWLQGLNAPGSAWAVQLAHFSRTHRSVVPDARGVGKSGQPRGPYTTAQMADDALRVLDACQVDSAHVVGLSLGGATAQELALRAPERVKSLTLIGTFAGTFPRQQALLEAWRALYPVALAAPGGREAWEKQAYAWLFTDAFWKKDTNVRAALRFAGTQPAQTPEGFQGQVDAALTHDTRARLPGLKLPTLVIHGALDQLAPVEAGHELARLIPGAELLVVPDAGHAVNLESQRAVHAALRAHWAKV
ncbi:MAG: alpha/beta fold hydrolase [Deltaproteobacteria bacterium]|nr:alpha/beta fold hydrolase [Deltaproteobacteria bacterium]